MTAFQISKEKNHVSTKSISIYKVNTFLYFNKHRGYN